MKKALKVIFGIALLLSLVYVLGPHPSKPKYSTTFPTIPNNPDSLDKYIANEEATHKLRKDNEARIVWFNDSLKTQTEYAIVYLHGFSASQGEGAPSHTTIAKEFGCNLYLSRLAEHGIDTSEQLIRLTADSYWETAKEALAIGKKIGKNVILMGTSTGGTLALQLAATYPDDVAGLILYSPNVSIYDKNAWLLNKPWGLQIARKVVGGNYLNSSDTSELSRRYWNMHYRLESAVAVQEIVSTSMTKENFVKIHQPTLALFYYKDEEHQDHTVKVEAIKNMITTISTPDSLKRAIAIPNAGNHVLGSPIRSKDVASVIKETERFLSEVMHLH